MNLLWDKSTEILQVRTRISQVGRNLTPQMTESAQYLNRRRPSKVSHPQNMESNVRFLEAMNARHENHPYFTVRLASCMDTLGATAICARLLRQVFTNPPISDPP